MENKIYNELNHDPLVWGVSFQALMVLLSSLVLCTTVFMNAWGVAAGFGIPLAGHLLAYLVLVQVERMDKLEWQGRWQKAVSREIDSFSKSTQELMVK